MIAADLWLHVKDGVVAATGLSRPALHVAAGVTLFTALAPLLPRRRRLALAWTALLALELVNEAIDQQHLLAVRGAFDPVASLYDIVDTMMLPTLFLLWRALIADHLHGYRRMLQRSRRRRRARHTAA